MKQNLLQRFLLSTVFLFLVSSSDIYAQWITGQERVINGVKYALYQYKYSDHTEYLAWTKGYVSTIPANITIPNQIIINENTTADGVYPVEHIQANTFEGCTTLHTVTSKIDRAYSIQSYAFFNCANLREVNNIAAVGIGSRAFVGCTSLTSINNISSAGEYAFGGCYNLKNITFSDSLNIDFHAFEGCSSLKDFKFPKTVLAIYPYAFKDCTSLTEVSFPPSLKKTDRYSFQNCTSLKRVIIEDGDEKFEPGDFGTDSEYAFDGCNVEYLYMGRNISSLGQENSLKTLEIGERVNNISSSCFRNYEKLSSVILPNSLKEFGYSAFENCTALKTITLPDSIKTIGSYAFHGCTSLDSINSNIKDIRSVTVRYNPFYRISSNAKLYVPKGQRQYYAKNSNFDQFRFIWEKETEKIDDICKLSNGKIYSLQPEDARRGIIFTQTGSEYLDACGGIYNNPNVVINDSEPNQQFAIYKHNGKYYLYSIGQKKFVSNYETVGSNVFFKLDSKPNQAITINQSSVDGEFIFVVGDKEWINVTSRTYGCVGDWEIEDGGNRISIIETGNISNESLLEIKQAFGETKDGDANGNGEVEIGDVTSVLTLMATPEATGYNNEAADANGNGEIEIGDVTTILTNMANGGE